MKYSKRHSTIRSYFCTFVFAAIFVFIIKSIFVTTITISGPSMAPTLNNSQKALCFKKAKIKRGSVIVFNANGVDPSVDNDKEYIKRVVGLPGDRVVSRNGKIYINGQILNQRYISQRQRTLGTGDWNLKSLAKLYHWPKNKNTLIVPKDHYFCLGDNREVSHDCRSFGFVPKKKIWGVVKVPMFYASNIQRQKVNKEWKNEEIEKG